jgi:hypothetical protein
MTIDEKHEAHIPKCRCATGNNCIHGLSCKWANAFMQEFTPDREITDDEFFDNKMTICCCSPEIPHGESMKFKILTKNENVL